VLLEKLVEGAAVVTVGSMFALESLIFVTSAHRPWHRTWNKITGPRGCRDPQDVGRRIREAWQKAGPVVSVRVPIVRVGLLSSIAKFVKVWNPRRPVCPKRRTGTCQGQDHILRSLMRFNLS
jgi:hypothetical protein